MTPKKEVYVIAPSARFKEHEIRDGEQWLKERGFIIKQPARLRDPSFGYFNGTLGERFSELRESLEDAHDGIIWLARGGAGQLRLLPLLPKEINGRPLFIGFSDGTALLSQLWTQYALPGIHGPNIKNLRELPKEAEESLINLISGKIKDVVYPVLSVKRWESSKENIEGIIICANLTVLSRLVGTQSFPIQQPTILIIEDINEHLYRVHDMLTQLAITGSLKEVIAIVLGHFTECGDTLLIKKLFIDFAEELSIPLLTGLPVGHEHNNWPVPFGLKGLLTRGEQNEAHLSLLESF